MFIIFEDTRQTENVTTVHNTLVVIAEAVTILNKPLTLIKLSACTIYATCIIFTLQMIKCVLMFLITDVFSKSVISLFKCLYQCHIVSCHFDSDFKS